MGFIGVFDFAALYHLLADSTGFRGKMPSHWYCWRYFAVGL